MDYKELEDRGDHYIVTLFNDRQIRMDIIFDDNGKKWLDPKGHFLDDGSETFASMSWETYKSIAWTGTLKTTQCLVAFGKYLSGYRPGDEGWTELDQEVYDKALKG